MTSPCETPCETFIVCSTGAGALLAPFIRFGSDPPFPAGAILAMLGTGSSFDAAVSDCACPFLMTSGCASTADDGVLFTVTSSLADSESPGFDLAFAGCACTFFTAGDVEIVGEAFILIVASGRGAAELETAEVAGDGTDAVEGATDGD